MPNAIDRYGTTIAARRLKRLKAKFKHSYTLFVWEHVELAHEFLAFLTQQYVHTVVALCSAWAARALKRSCAVQTRPR